MPEPGNKKTVSETAKSLISAIRDSRIRELSEFRKLVESKQWDINPAELLSIGDALISGMGRFGYLTHVPEWLTSAIATIAKPEKTGSICIPWAGAGFFEGFLHHTLCPEKTLACAPNMELGKLGKSLAPEVDWLCGDPLDALEQTTVEFDLVAANLPLNARTERSLRVELATGGSVDFQGDLGNLLLVASTKKLSTDGVGLFIVPLAFFFSAKSVFHRLSECGLGVAATFELPSGTFAPFTNISMYLIVVQNKLHEKMFVGELSKKGDNSQVIENYHQNKEGATLSLGRVVESATFHGLNAIRAKEAFEEKQRSFGAPAALLGELATAMKSGRAGEKNQFREEENSFYIPTAGQKDIAESVADLEMKHQNYIQVKIDPARSYSGFVVRYLRSEFGRELLAEHTAGIAKPRLGRQALEDLPIFIPTLQVQKSILEIDSIIDREQNTILALENEILELRRKLWSSPSNATDVVRELENLSDKLSGDVSNHVKISLEQWFETLPFPLATILRAWQACPSEDHKTRYEHLLHFFEATAEFLGIVLLSAYASNSAIFDPHKQKLKESMQKQNLSFQRATFGTWKLVLEYLGKQTRLLIACEGKKGEAAVSDQSLCKEMFSDPSLQLPKVLARKELCSIFSATNKMRNDWSGHGGVVGQDEARYRNEKLLSQVQLLREVFEDTWEGIQLVSAGTFRKKGGFFETEVAVAMGSNSEFLNETRKLVCCLDDDFLYLLHKDAQKALELLPLVQVGPSPPFAKNACYFFNRLDKDGARFVSYHYVDTPERNFANVAETIRFLAEE